MIHQHIFASPKPGMSEQEFQRYWVEEHAVRYASKIPQIKKYLVGTRIDSPLDKGGEPMFGGIAEIWLRNDEEQLASLQTPEFLQGARLDEANWAAFWKTLVLDTDAREVLAGPPLSAGAGWVKAVALYRRRPGVTLAAFRHYALAVHSAMALDLPGLRRMLQCFTRDSWYGFGEPRFDAVGQLYFDDLAALEAAMQSPVWAALHADVPNFADPEQVFTMTVREHWIIGPEPRA